MAGTEDRGSPWTSGPKGPDTNRQQQDHTYRERDMWGYGPSGTNWWTSSSLGRGSARRFTRGFRCCIRDRLWLNFRWRCHAASLSASLRNFLRRMFESFDLLLPKRVRFVRKGFDDANHF